MSFFVTCPKYLILLPTRGCPRKVGLGLSLALCKTKVLDFSLSSCADGLSSVAGAPMVLCPPCFFVFLFLFSLSDKYRK